MLEYQCLIFLSGGYLPIFQRNGNPKTYTIMDLKLLQDRVNKIFAFLHCTILSFPKPDTVWTAHASRKKDKFDFKRLLVCHEKSFRICLVKRLLCRGIIFHLLVSDGLEDIAASPSSLPFYWVQRGHVKINLRQNYVALRAVVSYTWRGFCRESIRVQ